MNNIPVTLVILDGWGSSEKTEGNAIAKASLPNFQFLLKEYPNNILHTCGKAVGLPEGVMGNSEVGHENIGGGRVVIQKLTLISQSIEDKSFFSNKVMLDVISHVKKHSSKLHVIGLISEGDVHSHMGHLYAILELASQNKVDKVIIHPISDGRDDPPKSAVPLFEKLEEKCKKYNARIATVSGRFYAMDRDNRWNRIKLYYDLITQGKGLKSSSVTSAIQEAYSRGEKKDRIIYPTDDCPLENSDEFILPTIIESKDSLISDNDGVIFFNFRPDRAREISTALTQKNFSDFDREVIPENLSYVCLTNYDSKLHNPESADPVLPVAFSKDTLKEVNKNNSIGELISKLNKKQIRIAETEKFRHITSFFNMGREDEFGGEERVLIPSPKVSTYDQKPEMSANEVGAKVIEAIKSKKYSLIAVNFANADMVGHTGSIPDSIKAVEVLDKLLGEIYKANKETNGVLIITADHGNADQMINDDGTVRTAHSLNPVPFIMVNENLKNAKLKPEGVLADIAPTILDIMNIDKPDEMTGSSLISNKKELSKI